MIPEDGQGVGGHGPGRDMEDGGQKFAGDLEHVGNHEEEALGGGEGSGQRSGGKAPVYRAGRAGLGLHFPDRYSLAKDVFLPFSCPFIRYLAHSGRRGNGINGRRVT